MSFCYIENYLQDYSQYAEVYTVAGDTNTKGAAFLAEAEGYMRTHSFERGGDTRLATLQATLLLYERCVRTWI